MAGYSWLCILTELCLIADTGMLAVNGSPVCPPGRYGDNCSQYCHANCKTCNESGKCDTCTDKDVYGPLCDKMCALCKNGACSKLRCEDGCAEGWFEHTEWRGLQPVYSCERCSGGCTRCESRNNCTSCIRKRWGTTCYIRCPNGCKLCDKSTGTCCGQGNFLDSYGKCTLCPHNCLSCKSRDKCTACVGERYGLTCAIVNCSSIQHCSECKCDSDTCESKNISCLKCESGFTGDKCQHSEVAGQPGAKHSNDRNKNNSDPNVNGHNNKDPDFNHKSFASQNNVTILNTPSTYDLNYTDNITYTYIDNQDNSTNENDTLKENYRKHGGYAGKEELQMERVAESKTGAKEDDEKQQGTGVPDSSWSVTSTVIAVSISSCVMVIGVAVAMIYKRRRKRSDSFNVTQSQQLLSYLNTGKYQHTPSSNIDNTSL